MVMNNYLPNRRVNILHLLPGKEYRALYRAQLSNSRLEKKIYILIDAWAEILRRLLPSIHMMYR